ncbi:MAG: type II secretion system protein [Nitrospirota bacterium]
MRNEGVSLLELVVAMSVICVLAVALGFSFQGWMGAYRVESETKELYSDLMDAKTRAMTRNQMHFILLDTENYQIFEDTNNNSSPDPYSGDNPVGGYTNPKNLAFPLERTGMITFDTRGLTASAAAVSIPVSPPPGVVPDYNCVIIYQSRIRLGRMYEGTCGG